MHDLRWRERSARGRLPGWSAVSGHRLVIDLSNKSAQVLDPAGRCVWIVSDVTRRTATDRATEAGWYVSEDWQLTSPPDGYSCPVLTPAESEFTDEEARACFADHGGLPI